MGHYRPNAAAIIFSHRYPKICEIFVAKRNDIKNVWQFPQGGINKNEKPKQAIIRELEEEIGTKDFDIIAQCPFWQSYDFPPKSKKKFAPYDGQKQKYFLVKLHENAKINLQTAHPEFNEYKFIDVKNILQHVTPFKKKIYKEVLQYFEDEGFFN